MTWCLVGNTGAVHMLPRSMIFVGRDNCEINLTSRSVDKRHSVINFDRRDDAFCIKDMDTLNGTFVNDTRIPDSTYINLQRGDSIRFGYDPVTYRFDEVDSCSIRQVQAEDGVNKLEVMDGAVRSNEMETKDGGDENKYDEEMKEGYQARPSRHHSSHSGQQYDARTTPVENRMMSHGRTTPLKQEFPVSSQPSPLYGQPAWWGQDDVTHGEGPVKDREEDGRKSRTSSYPTNGKDADAFAGHPGSRHLQRPTRLPLNEPERDRDIPVHLYTRPPPADPHPSPPPGRHPPTEVTLVSASEKHVGFTIEFNAKEDAPKLSMNESLSEFVPAGVRSKFEGSSKMVEEMKAERIKKSVTDDQDSYQSPRMSPSAVQKLNTMWSSGKKGSKAGQGEYRTANSSETGKLDAAKPLKVRPNVLPRQPVPSKSGPAQSSHSPHRPDDDDHRHHHEQNGDNVSESGTYTIESESQSKEVLEARSKIDEVFGVGGGVGAGSMDVEQGSDEDTDKDVEDHVIQEEAVTVETAPGQEKDAGKYLDRVYGKPSDQEAAKPPFQPKPPSTGSSTAPAWVRQWAVLASKDTVPREPSRSPRSDASQSPRNYGQGTAAAAAAQAEEDVPGRCHHPSGPGPTAPPRRGGKRLLPTTPPERGDGPSPHLTSSEESPRPNGLHVRQSPSSAFYSPRNQEDATSAQQQGEPSANEPKPVSVGTPVTNVGSSSAAPVHNDEDFHTEVSVDTEILLKDTETFVKSLEMRMRERQRSTPSPDISESYDLSHRSFDGDIDTDLDSCVSLVGTSGAYPLKTNQASLPPSGYQSKRGAQDRKPESKTKTPDEKPKKGGIWNRLSQPSRYKKTAPDPSKDSVTSDGMSDSMDSASFRRNTNVTASLPTGRITGRKTPRESDSKDTSPKIIRKIKANLSKPRQTRSTMLRKSRFDGKDSPGPGEHSDISPSSSISDMSSSRNASALRRSVPSQRESLGARGQVPKDLPSRTKTAAARVDTGRPRIGSRSSEQTPRSEVSLGAQIVQQARSQSMRERRMNSGEASARVMGRVQNASSTRTSATASSRKSSLSSTDAAALKKAPTGAWRRYKEPPMETDAVDAYIRTVTSRQSSISSADESSIKSAPAYNYYKPRNSSSGDLSHQHHQQQHHQHQHQHQQQRTATSLQHLAGAGVHVHRQQQQQWSRQEGLRNGTAAAAAEDDVAQASTSLAENLQRLAKGESTLGMAMEHIPKDERMMDEILSEDTVGVNERAPPQRDENNHKQPLQRSTSLGYNNTEGLFPLSPPTAQPGSPPVAMKHKQWTKPESFDMLVMSSINHLSIKLKDSTDKLAYKLKKLQSPNATDAELREVLKDADSPLLKTHNKEIASILKNMRQLEKRLSEIHTMIDPRDEIEVPNQMSPAAQIRRKYISDYGAGGALAGPAGGQSGQGPSPGKGAGAGQTPRSSRSDESEYYV